jgi:DNA-binding NarL/FixJ family response regulator
MNAASKKTVRIMLVDDSPIIRLGVQRVIASQSDLAICCETDTIAGALATIRTSRVDLAIVEPSLRTEDGLELIRQLREIKPRLRVLVFTLDERALSAEPAFKAGADGYVTKKEAPDRLIHAIREVLAGRLYASQRLPPK